MEEDSENERELQALAGWLETFPGCFAGPLSSAGKKAILDVFQEAYGREFIPLQSRDEDCDREDGSELLFWSSLSATAGVQTCTSNDKKHMALSGLLCTAVAHKILEKRKLYIEKIMMLPPDMQRSLMSLIERSKVERRAARRGSPRDSKQQTSLLMPQNCESREDQKGVENLDVARKALFVSPRFSSNRKDPYVSPGLGDSGEYQRIVDDLTTANDELQRNLSRSQAQAKDLAIQMEAMAATHRKALLQVELKNSNEVASIKESARKQIESMKAILENMERNARLAQDENARLLAWKDECELASHSRDMLDAANERLVNYRERLQQLSDVRDALGREEAAHKKAVETCIALENEVKILAPLKLQVNEYMERILDAEMMNTTQKDTIQGLESKIANLEAENQDLSSQLQCRKKEIQELQTRIALSRQIENKNDSLGEGIGELNPDVMEEIIKLRNENRWLRDEKSKSSSEAVSRMEQGLEEASRRNERISMQLHHVRNELESTSKELREAEKEKGKLQERVCELENDAKTAEDLVEEQKQDIADLVAKVNKSKENESRLMAEISEWMEQVDNLQSHSADLSKRIEDKEHELRGAQLEVTRREEELHATKISLRQTESSLEMLGVLHKQKTEEYELAHRQLKEAESESHKWQFEAMEAQSHSDEMAKQLQQCASQLEEARLREKELRVESLSLSDEKTAIQKRLREEEDEKEKAVVAVASLEKMLKDCKEQLAGCQKELADAVNHAEEAESFVNELNGKLKDAKDELYKSHESYASLKSIAENQGATLSIRDIELQDLKVQCEQLERDLGSSQASLSTSQSQQEELSNSLSDANDKLRMASMELATLTEEKLHVDGQLEVLRNDLQEASRCHAEAKESEQRLKTLLAMERQRFHDQEEAWEIRLSRSEEEKDTVISDMVQKQISMEEEVLRSNKELQQMVTSQKLSMAQACKELNDRLFSSQEEVQHLRSKLSSSEHREKIQQVQIQKLEDKVDQLRADLCNAEAMLQRAQNECMELFENERGEIEEKHKKDLHEMRSNMNKLLEDERKAKKFEEELRVLEIEKLQEEMQERVSQIEEKSKKTLQKALEDASRAHSSNIEDVHARNRQAMDDLVVKGRNFIEKLRQEHQQAIDDLNSDLDEMTSNFNAAAADRQEIANSYMSKVSEHKKKLGIASSEISLLSSRVEELEEDLLKVSREKDIAIEEAEHIRRQVGGRFGGAIRFKSQIELLQSELQQSQDEVHHLRQQLALRHHEANAISPSEELSYSRANLSSSTLVQLRAEYEATIDELHDEKRELIMKHSAALADIQAAEQKTWEAEQEISALKMHICSLRLQVERMSVESSGHEKAIAVASHTTSPSHQIERSDTPSEIDDEQQFSKKLSSARVDSAKVFQRASKGGRSTAKVASPLATNIDSVNTPLIRPENGVPEGLTKSASGGGECTPEKCAVDDMLDENQHDTIHHHGYVGTKMVQSGENEAPECVQC